MPHLRNDTRGGEKPGRREAVERFARKLVKNQGMSPEKAKERARRHAVRVERGAVQKR